jgi:hypothetical protein
MNLNSKINSIGSKISYLKMVLNSNYGTNSEIYDMLIKLKKNMSFYY